MESDEMLYDVDDYLNDVDSSTQNDHTNNNTNSTKNNSVGGINITKGLIPPVTAGFQKKKKNQNPNAKRIKPRLQPRPTVSTGTSTGSLNQSKQRPVPQSREESSNDNNFVDDNPGVNIDNININDNAQSNQVQVDNDNTQHTDKHAASNRSVSFILDENHHNINTFNTSSSSSDKNKIHVSEPSSESQNTNHIKPLNQKRSTSIRGNVLKPKRPIANSISNSHSNTNTNMNTTVRKGLSISIGSTIPNIDEFDHDEQPTSTIITISKTQQQITPSSTAQTRLSGGATTNSTNTTASSSLSVITPPVDIIPYQHLGQLDPAWNIPAPKPNEFTMKDFCTKFKIPKEDKKKDTPNATNTTTDTTNHTEANTTTTPNTTNNNNNTSTNTQHNQQEHDDSTRSGPLVQIINGEIVIKESSIIIGGRVTTEEVDKEYEDNIIVEDNAFLTATYNSFRRGSERGGGGVGGAAGGDNPSSYKQMLQHWTPDETKKFYEALRQCGTDFSTMMSFFENDGERRRNRRQLKNKYLVECRKNPKLIDMAMNPTVQIPLDVSIFGELEIDPTPPITNNTNINTQNSTSRISQPTTNTPMPTFVNTTQMVELGNDLTSTDRNSNTTSSTNTITNHSNHTDDNNDTEDTSIVTLNNNNNRNTNTTAINTNNESRTTNESIDKSIIETTTNHLNKEKISNDIPEINNFSSNTDPYHDTNLHEGVLDDTLSPQPTTTSNTTATKPLALVPNTSGSSNTQKRKFRIKPTKPIKKKAIQS